jgi:glycosyltransferase involved in cell wall biosynthesis
MDPMKILHLIDSLDYGGSACQLRTLAPGLGDHVEVCCLGPEMPWSTALRQAGVTVHTLGWTRWLDFSAWWNLREIVHGMNPDVVHVWRLPALRMLAVVAKDRLPRTVVSGALPAAGKLAWWDRRLLQQVRCVAVASTTEREHGVRLGLVHPAVHVVPLAVDCPPAPATASASGRSIVCVGRLDRAHGMRQAVWAFDIICHLRGDVNLDIVGDGPELAALRELTIGLQNSAVAFHGSRADATDVLAGADVVWAPSQASCGQQAALEAMALGRVVIASDVPCLRELIQDGETGFLVPVGDVVQVARRTHGLLNDAGLRDRVGSAARESVNRRYRLVDALAQWREVYRAVAA